MPEQIATPVMLFPEVSGNTYPSNANIKNLRCDPMRKTLFYIQNMLDSNNTHETLLLYLRSNELIPFESVLVL